MFFELDMLQIHHDFLAGATTGDLVLVAALTAFLFCLTWPTTQELNLAERRGRGHRLETSNHAGGKENGAEQPPTHGDAQPIISASREPSLFGRNCRPHVFARHGVQKP